MMGRVTNRAKRILTNTYGCFRDIRASEVLAEEELESYFKPGKNY